MDEMKVFHLLEEIRVHLYQADMKEALNILHDLEEDLLNIWKQKEIERSNSERII